MFLKKILNLEVLGIISCSSIKHIIIFLDASDLTKEEKVNIFEALFWNIILL